METRKRKAKAIRLCRWIILTLVTLLGALSAVSGAYAEESSGGEPSPDAADTSSTATYVEGDVDSPRPENPSTDEAEGPVSAGMRTQEEGMQTQAEERPDEETRAPVRRRGYWRGARYARERSEASEPEPPPEPVDDGVHGHILLGGVGVFAGEMIPLVELRGGVELWNFDVQLNLHTLLFVNYLSGVLRYAFTRGSVQPYVFGQGGGVIFFGDEAEGVPIFGTGVGVRLLSSPDFAATMFEADLGAHWLEAEPVLSVRIAMGLRF